MTRENKKKQVILIHVPRRSKEKHERSGVFKEQRLALMRQRPPTRRSSPPLNLHGARGKEEQIVVYMFFCFIIRSGAAWALSRRPDESVDTSMKGLTE